VNCERVTPAIASRSLGRKSIFHAWNAPQILDVLLARHDGGITAKYVGCQLRYWPWSRSYDAALCEQVKSPIGQRLLLGVIECAVVQTRILGGVTDSPVTVRRYNGIISGRIRWNTVRVEAKFRGMPLRSLSSWFYCVTTQLLWRCPPHESYTDLVSVYETSYGLSVSRDILNCIPARFYEWNFFFSNPLLWRLGYRRNPIYTFRVWIMIGLYGIRIVGPDNFRLRKSKRSFLPWGGAPYSYFYEWNLSSVIDVVKAFTYRITTLNSPRLSYVKTITNQPDRVRFVMQRRHR